LPVSAVFQSPSVCSTRSSQPCYPPAPFPPCDHDNRASRESVQYNPKFGLDKDTCRVGILVVKAHEGRSHHKRFPKRCGGEMGALPGQRSRLQFVGLSFVSRSRDANLQRLRCRPCLPSTQTTQRTNRARARNHQIHLVSVRLLLL
jgi:hypothetical protein